ncbi:MAG: helix-turn-helix transcriptional regulator [Acetobacteraceae bacterium]|nr:helix-turn-helix transcriptional regulator [Acetobacteraceae bacterium]
MTGRGAIPRVAYVTAGCRSVLVVYIASKTSRQASHWLGRRSTPGNGIAVTGGADAVATTGAPPVHPAAADKSEPALTLAAALGKARAGAGMTRDEVAQAIGLTPAAVERMESGRLRPSMRTLERFAEATGMRLRISFEQPNPARPA